MYNQDIKMYIKRLYSAELEHDETIGAAMERQQLRKWLLAWANDCIDETMQKIQLDIKVQKIQLDIKDKKTQHWYHQE